MPKLSIHDLDLVRKRVFVRVDFNVPMKDGRIADDTRIHASMPTIEFAMAHGATVILASHLGRPKGKPSPQLSLRPVAARLSELLGRPVAFADDCIGAPARTVVDEVYGKGGGIWRAGRKSERSNPPGGWSSMLQPPMHIASGTSPFLPMRSCSVRM